MPKLEDIDCEIKDIQKRMRRFLETGDIRRLMRLKMRLAQLKFDLDLLRKKEDLANAAEDLVRLVKVTPARFRRSYAYEFWVERLVKKHTLI
jgi:hypothetical protein